MTKEKEFLEIFNRLEKYLRVEYSRDNYTYSGFMSIMYKIRKGNKNPLISDKYNFDIIHQASRIRNIIAHNNDVLVPSDKFIKDFEKVVEKICNPLKVKDVMISLSKLKTACLEDTIGYAISLLKKHGYNTIPIIDENKLLGIFTEKSVYDYLSIKKNKHIDIDMKIKDVLEAIDLNFDPRKYFNFIGKSFSIEKAYSYFNVDLKSRRELLLLLVTETGDIDENILGIITLRDVENALLN